MKATQTFKINTLLSSALIAAVPLAMHSGNAKRVEVNAETSKPETSAPDFQIGSDELEVKAQAIDVARWTAEKNIRFKHLARKEAIGDISVEELVELDTLTKLRRFEKYPRSADEILWQRKQQQLTRNIVQALEAYVEFHEASRGA